MPAVQRGVRFEEIARKWHDLAERRVAYYQELYRSGRWKRYFRTREEFAVRMLDVIRVARTFAAQCGRGAPAQEDRDALRPAA